MVGVEGPDHTWKLPSGMDTQFRKLALLAAADSAVGRDVPDLGALLDRVDAKLAANPMVVRVPDPAGVELERLWDGEWRATLLQAALERVKGPSAAKRFKIPKSPSLA